MTNDELVGAINREIARKLWCRCVELQKEVLRLKEELSLARARSFQNVGPSTPAPAVLTHLDNKNAR